MENISFTLQDSGRSIEVPRDSIIAVELEDRSGGGYRWVIDSLDQSILKVIGEETLPYAGVGAGGRHVVRLQALKPGGSQLSLKLWRSWEGDRSIIERFQIFVKVSGG